MIRLHVNDALGVGAEVAPDAGQAHYLLNVMRLKAGEELLLFNGRDGEWRAMVAEADKRRCQLRALVQTRPQSSPPDLELAIALVKRARLETIVEKAAELGCRRVRLILTRRTNADHAKTDRLQAIATEASEQTGRLDVPEVLAPVELDRFLGDWPEGRRLMFCDEAGDDPEQQWGGEGGRARPVLDALPSPLEGEGSGAGGRTEKSASAEPPKGTRIDDPRGPPPSIPPPRGGREAENLTPSTPAWTILIGPEGGFDPDERERLRALPFVTPVTLGPRILRADTAAISALTLWQAALGDWR
jgi:16S rRNA (uracil1498-N3)-methyltransferase